MFPFRSFLYNFTLDNSNHVISAWQVRKKTMYWSPRHWIYFKATASILCLYFFVTPVQIQCPFLYTLLYNCILSPPICLFFLFPVICFKLNPIIWTFFDFPRRFKLSGVNCISLDPRKKEVTLCRPPLHPASFTVKCKNFTSSRKEIARKKLCEFAYFADTIQEMIFSWSLSISWSLSHIS